MQIFINIIASGLNTCGIYALAALGIILIYRTSDTTNYAQGTISTFGAYIGAWFSGLMATPINNFMAFYEGFKNQGMSHEACVAATEAAGVKFPGTISALFLKYGEDGYIIGFNGWAIAIVSAILAMICAVILGVLIDRIIISRARHSNPLTKQIITLGLISVFLGLSTAVFGSVRQYTFFKFAPGTVNIAGANVAWSYVANIAISAVLIAIMFTALIKTKWGLSVRATSSNEMVARMMGIPTPIITMVSWAIAAAVGTLAALMYAPTTTLDTSLMNSIQVISLLACVLGGFETFHGPIIAACIIALFKSLVQFYGGDFAGSYIEAITYVFVLVLMLIRPQGLFGKKIVKKV
ncbi:MAG: branched-chain amino acid ABC transporter permease [Clostridia bacterium]|nr:branched-chain amino acid ABC transporter permease [Clostridia bacterium]